VAPAKGGGTVNWKLREAGYPSCHVSCARRYFMAVWDIGVRYEMRIKMGLS
jgi:hypothetical protein